MIVRNSSIFTGMTTSENQKQPFSFFLMPVVVSYQNLKAHLDLLLNFSKPVIGNNIIEADTILIKFAQ